MKKELDVLDEKILALLDADCRMPAAEIGRKVKASKSRVQYRINRAKKHNIIVGFHALINLHQIGYDYYEILVKLTNNTPRDDERIITFFTEQQACLEARTCEGRYDLALLLCTKRPHQTQDIFNTFREQFGDLVQRWEVHLVLESWKHCQHYLHNQWHTDIKIDHDTPHADLDDLDLDILDRVQASARISVVDIAREIDAEPRTVLNRMRNLEEKNIIAGYTTALDIARIGYMLARFAIRVRDPDVIPEIREYLVHHGNAVRTVYLLGEFDLMIDVCVEGQPHLQTIVKEFRERFAKRCASYVLLTITQRNILGWMPK